MTAHETSRPATQICLRVDLSLEQQAVARTMPPNPSLGGTAPPNALTRLPGAPVVMPTSPPRAPPPPAPIGRTSA